MDRRPPYEAYAAIMGTFAGGLAAAGALGRLLDRDPQCQDALDLTVLAAATFKAARTLARDEVTSFIREPFVRGHATRGTRSRSRPATRSRRSASSSRAAAASAPGPPPGWRRPRCSLLASAGC